MLALWVMTLTTPTFAEASNGAYAWGGGILGDGSEYGSDRPVAVRGLTGVTAVASGRDNSYALLADGTVMAWGEGYDGNLGDGSTARSLVPVQVTGISEATAVAGGFEFGLALLHSGRVMAWGYNSFGQLGTGSTTGPEKCERSACSRVPIPIPGLTEVTAISAYGNHAFALLRNGMVMAWGLNESGSLGNGSFTQQEYPTPAPVSGLSEVAAIANTMALLKDGTVMDWGGELGNGTNGESDVPVPVAGLTGVVGLPPSAGRIVLEANGTVMDWGAGYSGQLGNGTQGNNDIALTPVEVAGLFDAVAVAGGLSHNLALRANGTVMAWGSGRELGDGSAGENSDVPVPVLNMNGASAIASAYEESLAAASPARAVVLTGEASAIGGTTATLNATVNPSGGEVSECAFEYGVSASYGSSAPCSPSPGAGDSPVTVSASVAHLIANTTYHFRILARDLAGASYGSDGTFTTSVPAPPTVASQAASSIGSDVATLNATVNPNGGALSACRFEFGPSEAYGSTTVCNPFPGPGESPVPASASVSGLAPATTYHYRFVASNAGGTEAGSDATFTTLPAPRWYRNQVLVKTRVPVIGWGTLALNVAGGSVTCHTASGGYVENRGSNPGGTGVTETFAAYRCEPRKVCPSGQLATVAGEGLPWPSVLALDGAGSVVSRSAGLELTVECSSGGKVESTLTFLTNAASGCCATVSALVLPGSSALFPTAVEYGLGPGLLEGEGSAGAVTASIEGEVKTFGYAAQELLTAK
jgi:hypothetical protein